MSENLQPTCNQLATDTISRQAAIDTVRNIRAITGTEDDSILLIDKAEVQTELMMLPSAPQWIPCSERLPVDDDYRESMECLDGCVWYFTDKGSMGLGYYYYSTKAWSTLRDLKPDGKVIAWMPLPKPYKGQRSKRNG